MSPAVSLTILLGKPDDLPEGKPEVPYAYGKPEMFPAASLTTLPRMATPDR